MTNATFLFRLYPSYSLFDGERMSCDWYSKVVFDSFLVVFIFWLKKLIHRWGFIENFRNRMDKYGERRIEIKLMVWFWTLGLALGGFTLFFYQPKAPTPIFIVYLLPIYCLFLWTLNKVWPFNPTAFQLGLQ